MKKLNISVSTFLLVTDKGKILYCSDDLKVLGLSEKIIREIIKSKGNTIRLKRYDIDIKEIQGYEELYAVKIACKDMERIAYTDCLTNLYNRNLWEWIKNHGFIGKYFRQNSLVIVDIDNLKGINDTAGHQEGDKCIKLVADAIKSCIREDDLAFRFGGDEFIIILFGSRISQARKVVARIKERVREKIDTVSISAGIASFNSFESLDEAFNKADKEMYREKRLQG